MMAEQTKANITWAVVDDKGDDYTVCSFVGDPRNGIMDDVICEITSINEEEDAHLIAAAPEMLKALKDLDESILGSAESNASGNPKWEYVSKRIKAARAAIAKAECRS